MLKEIKQVNEFMTTFGQEVKMSPSFPKEKIMKLRVALLVEEVKELEEAINDYDMVGILDALTDIQYVLSGAYLAFGLQGVGDAAFDEVQRSNMSKLTADGKVLYNEAGKVQKSDQYFKPNLKKVLLDYLKQNDDFDLTTLEKDEKQGFI